jgi:hypothetical protein
MQAIYLHIMKSQPGQNPGVLPICSYFTQSWKHNSPFEKIYVSMS